MALIIEDGSGVFNANSYNSLAFTLAYLTERNRQTENGWDALATAVQEAHSIAAVDYIESIFSQLFRGQRQFTSLVNARSTLTFTQQPADTETIVIGTTTYTFNTVVGGANSILIGANTNASINNLISAINLSGTIGTDYGTGTVVNPDVAASAFEEDTMVAKALLTGTPGNSIAIASTVTGATWAGTFLAGGSDTGVSQLLSFPRVNLFDRDGQVVRGIPLKLKYAQAEYSVRAALATLSPDHVTDDRGGLVIEKEEVVGPIKERTKYQSGTRFSTIRSYPAADRLLQEYIQTGGMLIR